MKIEAKKKIKVIILSDGTGETATEMARAVITQFPSKEIFFTRYKNVRTQERVDAILSEASIHHDIVVYTIVKFELRKYVQAQSKKVKVRSVDLLGPLLTSFSNIFEVEPDYQPGLLHQVNDEYFRKVAAVEFTLNHDDGKNLATLEEADVILVGISRTSKTPLSIYLSMEGIKVVNIPIIPGSPIPEKLFKIDQRKIFGLTINPMTLHEIRKNRLTRLGVEQEGDYANIQKVSDEVEWANNLFSQNKRWPVFNVTDKALEETAAEIIKMLSMRSVNRFKQES